MKVGRYDVRGQPQQVVPGDGSLAVGCSNVADARKEKDMPEPGVYDLSDTSATRDSNLLNPFLASSYPSLDPDSGVFDVGLFFESVAKIRRQESNRRPIKAFGVAFQHLSVYGFKTSTDYQRTFGNYPATLYRKAFGHGKERVNILNSFDGLVHQGEMLLVLGRPGSGCSTLLKTIAGEMHGLHVGEQSEISYDGRCNKIGPTPWYFS